MPKCDFNKVALPKCDFNKVAAFDNCLLIIFRALSNENW